MMADDPHLGDFPPITDYALIGDTRTAALISKNGAIEWLCLPDFDSGSIFAAMLDRLNGGAMLLCPAGEAEMSRRYLGDAPVLETSWQTATGQAKVLDFMPLAKETASSLEPARQLLRIIDVTEGEVEMFFEATPRPEYATGHSWLRQTGSQGWTISAGPEAFLFRTDLDVRTDTLGRLRGRTRLSAGERRYVSLSYTGREIGIIPALARESEEKLEVTLDWWRGWEKQVDHEGPWRAQVRRSAMVLRLLTCSQSGAVIAAPTTSLPEVIKGRRNWDYRYCWPRDAAFLLDSFTALGEIKEAEAFFSWLLHATRLTRPRLATIYSIYGGHVPEERELQQFAGYRHSGPVRRGNAAKAQLQLDVYGSVIGAAYHFAEGGGQIDIGEASILRGFGKTACDSWRQPDEGIWELRLPRRHTTYGKASCWSALTLLLLMQERGHLEGIPEALFQAEADALREAILCHGWSEDHQAFTGAFGHDYLDAAVLMLPRLGVIGANHPKMRATFDRIEEELTQGALVRRYPHGMDGFERREGAFGICCFWAVEYLAMRGDHEEARRRFETLLALGSDLGLFPEEFDQETGQALGNYPQALTHAGLIAAALAIERAEKAAEAKVPA